MKKIIIASKNPVKISAVKQGFRKMLQAMEFEYISDSIASDVSDQPMTDEETFSGALNRANNASKKHPGADYWVGIEGGLQETDHRLQAFAWVCVLSKNKMGKARTATFLLPPEIVKLIHDGMELGDADDIVFKRSNSKQKDGAVGILTGNVIDRTKYYREAVILALIPFKNENLY